MMDWIVARTRRARVTFVLLLCAAASGCASAAADLEKRNSILDARVGELEVANRQLQLRLDAYEASLTLIEDQVTALEYGARRAANRTDQLAVVRVEPALDTAPARRTTTTTSASLYEDHDPYASLHRRDALDALDDEVVEIVVSEEKLERYFGGSSSASTASDTGGGYGLRPRTATSPSPARTPQPTVVHGERLPVVPMKKDGSGVVAAGNTAAPSAAPAGADPIDLYKAGLKHYRQEQFLPAIDLFQQFLAAKPPADYVDNALYWLGECHYGLAQYAEAATYFHRIVQEFPEANKVPDALLKVGLTYLRLDKTDSAREVMYYLIEAYPETEAARVARERLDKMNAS